MFSAYLKKPVSIIAAFFLLWLGIRYILPVALPFLLGTGIALAAEPLVGRLSLRLPRGAAAGIGVCATILGILGLLFFLGAFAVKKMGSLAHALPDLGHTTQQGIALLQDWLIGVSEQAPEEMRPALQRTVLDFFGNGTLLMDQVTQRIPSIVTSAVGAVGNGALGLGTGIVASFLISARLPRLRHAIAKRLPASWNEQLFPALRKIRVALASWCKAQLKLCAVTFFILTVGFVLLRIPYAPVWSAVVALIDAVPILGTGTVLIPWAIVCFLQKEGLRAITLLCLYGATAITRTVLEPRLVGKQLGLDPLTTLLALYVGYRFWGFLGLLLTPILASAAKSLFAPG